MASLKEILERLRALRLRKALRQEYVAGRLGIDRTTYVRKENGAIPITTDEWVMLAEAMEESPAYFFSGPAPIPAMKPSTELREALLVSLFRALNQDEREDLLSCLNLMLKGIRRKRVQETLERLKKL